MLQASGRAKRNDQNLNLKRISGKCWRDKSFYTQISHRNKLYKKFWNKTQISAICLLAIKHGWESSRSF